jgi:hypothetical protein
MPQLTITGLGFDDAAKSQQRYTFALSCRHPPDTGHTAELDDLIKSWNTVTFHGGFGGWSYQFSGPTHQPTATGSQVDFTVIGILSHSALAVLLRCLDVSDIDVFFDEVTVNVSEFPVLDEWSTTEEE